MLDEFESFLTGHREDIILSWYFHQARLPSQFTGLGGQFLGG